MPEPIRNNPPAPEPDRKQMMRVLIPAGAIALLVVLAAVLVAAFNNPAGDGNDDKDKKGGPGGKDYPPPTGGNDVSKLHNGEDPTAPDEELRDIGDGLKIRDLKEGDGAKVGHGQKVTAYYTGWLTNGTVFDSSRKKGKPIPFGLNEVIQGWTRGIPGMKVGGIRKLVIPSDLAYGPQGRPGIPPNSTLIFEVEIVDVE